MKDIAFIKYSKLSAILVVVLGFLSISFNSKDSELSYLKKDLNTNRNFANNSANEYNKKQSEFPIYGNWKSFTVKDGLPIDKTYSVKIDGDRVLIGTHKGLTVFENGKWKTYTTKDGLAHNGVLTIDISKKTGDVWLGTMGGLTRWSAGKFENFTQLNSGMPNDLIYSVVCDEYDVWVATAGGAGQYNTRSKQWKIYTEENAPMHEPWTYGISKGDGKIFIAAWGGGVIEYTKETQKFRDYVDPDKNLEIDLFPDDGIVHDITTGTSWSNGYLWVATYFGLSRYNGVHWKGYFDHDSGLASNFINYIKAVDGVAYIGTDKGLSTTDGENWVTYSKNKSGANGKKIITKNDSKKELSESISISHNFISGIDVENGVIWLATSKGVTRGELIK